MFMNLYNTLKTNPSSIRVPWYLVNNTTNKLFHYENTANISQGQFLYVIGSFGHETRKYLNYKGAPLIS